MRTLRKIIPLVALFLLAQSVSAEETRPAGKISGYLFGGYYYMLGAGTAATRGAQQYSSKAKDFQGFQFRRLYVIYDQPLSDKFTMQPILEGTDKSLDPS